jgi:hypothetical protein
MKDSMLLLAAAAAATATISCMSAEKVMVDSQLSAS